MQIDWFTLVATIINFLILVVILKTFLYKPIIKVMDEREEKIEARLREADEKIEKAEQEEQKYQKERQYLEDKRSEMLEEVRQQADDYQKQLYHEAREEVDQARQHWQTALEREKNDFLMDLRQRVSHQSSAVARRALQEMANVDLEERIIKVFLQRLEDVDKSKKEDIAAAIRTSDEEVLIRSVFEISPELREDLVHSINETFLNGDKVNPHFETTSDLISGIEFLVHGHRIAWTLEDYLESLEEQMGLAMEEKTMEENK